MARNVSFAIAVYDGILLKAGIKGQLERWSKFLGRKRKEWGDSRVEKAGWKLVRNHDFLAVVGMRAMATMIQMNFSDMDRETIALPFFKHFTEVFVSHAKSEKCKEDFGNEVLMALCAIKVWQGLYRTGEGFTIFKKLFSSKIIPVARNPRIEDAIQASRTSERWEMFEMLNLAQLGDSVKGKPIIFFFLFFPYSLTLFFLRSFSIE